MGPLHGVRVIVAGAGLAGLTAARSLAGQGASVRVIEARSRVGGCVWTWRAAPIAPYHVELGGEFIDKSHRALRQVCKELDLPLVRVLRRGFGAALGHAARTRVFEKQAPLWKSLKNALAPAVEALEDADRKWTSSAAAALAARSVEDLLNGAHVEPRVRALAVALRGLFLADPDRLSALVFVNQLLEGDPSRVPMYRIDGGNDRLPEALAKEAGRVDLGHVVRAVQQDERSVRVAIEGPSGRRAKARADYLIAAVPVPLLLEWEFLPALPKPQQHALRSLPYGQATKVILRFESRWWRQPGRPRAFATNMPIGAVWESAEEQPHAALLTLLAGGSASRQVRKLLSDEGPSGLKKRLQWFGRPRDASAVHTVVWEDDQWARGGYPYLSPGFDPGLIDLPGRAMGRVLFAGGHTSRDFQGYMNGAIDSGLRAAAEVSQLERIRRL